MTIISKEGIPLSTQKIKQNYWTVDTKVFKAINNDWYSNFLLTKDYKIF